MPKDKEEILPEFAGQVAEDQIGEPDLSEVQGAPESIKDERQERIESRKKKIAEWIQKINARSQDIKDWSDQKTKSRNVAGKEPNIGDVDEFSSG